MEQSPNVLAALWSCLWGSGRYLSYPFGPGSGLSFPSSTLSPSSSENTWCQDFPRHKQDLRSQTAQPLPSLIPKTEQGARFPQQCTSIFLDLCKENVPCAHLLHDWSFRSGTQMHPTQAVPLLCKSSFSKTSKKYFGLLGTLCGQSRMRWTLRNKLGAGSMLGSWCKTNFSVDSMFPWPLQHSVSAKVFLSSNFFFLTILCHRKKRLSD